MGGSPFARYIHCDIYYCLTTVNKGLYGTGKLLLNILFIALSLDCIICEYSVRYIGLYRLSMILLILMRCYVFRKTNKRFSQNPFFSYSLDIIQGKELHNTKG